MLCCETFALQKRLFPLNKLQISKLLFHNSLRSSSRKGETPEKDRTPISSPALSQEDTTVLSRETDSARVSTSPAVSRDDTFTARDAARNEYDVYDAEADDSVPESPAD